MIYKTIPWDDMANWVCDEEANATPHREIEIDIDEQNFVKSSFIRSLYTARLLKVVRTNIDEYKIVRRNGIVYVMLDLPGRRGERLIYPLVHLCRSTRDLPMEPIRTRDEIGEDG